MSVIHAFIYNESNLVFNSKLAIYHQHLNSIGEDRIPTSYSKSQGQREIRALEPPTPITRKNHTHITLCIKKDSTPTALAHDTSSLVYITLGKPKHPRGIAKGFGA